MAKGTFHIKLDVSALQKHIANYKARALDAVDDAMREDHIQVAKEFRATPYPPERPGQQYVRTGRLGRSWKHKRYRKTKSRVEWGVENKAAQRGRVYPSYVVGDEQGRQAWMHKGRWWVALAKYTETVGRRKQMIHRALNRLWKQTGSS